MTIKEADMDIGMLWYDNDPQSDLQAKVARASDYYRQKYGRAPRLCFVHPSMLPDQVQVSGNGENGDAEKMLKAGSLIVRCNKLVLPNHFWIGLGNAKDIKASEDSLMR
jgi:hypothetical protein